MRNKSRSRSSNWWPLSKW